MAEERERTSRVCAAMNVDPEYFRRKSQQTIVLARRTKNAENKAYLLSVAQRYEELAVEAEQR